MTRALVAIAAAGVSVAAAIMLTGEPENPANVVAVIVAIAAAMGALTALVLVPPRGPGRRLRARGTLAPALRRGLEVGVAVAMLLALRVVDGLSLTTGGFVVGAFALAEVILSTRRDARSG